MIISVIRKTLIFKNTSKDCLGEKYGVQSRFKTGIVIGSALNINGSFGEISEEQPAMFDKIGKIICNGNEVEYGFLSGDNRVVYIKSGMGGSYLGYEDKYLKIADRLHERCGCSVICVSNPVPLPIDVDLAILNEFVKSLGCGNPETYFFGHSNGCVKGLEIAAKGILFKRMVLINMPLMQNFHKTVNWIKLIPTTEIVTVYGQKDPSYSYIPFLECKNLSNVEIVKIQGADHNFRGMMSEFLELSDMLFK